MCNIRALFLIISMWGAVPTYATADADLDAVCITKLHVMDWTINSRTSVPVADVLVQWAQYFQILSHVESGLFTTKTDVDVQRVIRDVFRLSDKLTNPTFRDKFVHDEIRWCAIYGR